MQIPRPRLPDIAIILAACSLVAMISWLPARKAMAASEDKKGSALTGETAAEYTDELYVIRYVMGAPTSRKMSVSNFVRSLNLISNNYNGNLVVTGSVSSVLGGIGAVEFPSGTNTITLTAPTDLGASYSIVMPTNYPSISNAVVLLTARHNETNVVLDFAPTLTLTNFFYYTNEFAGGTNDLDVSIGEQDVDTYTPIEISGFINFDPIAVRGTTLFVYNASSSNITVSWPASVRTTGGTPSTTITNGHAKAIYFQVRGTRSTNAAPSQALW